MTLVDAIVAYCDEYLGAARIRDYCPNGLQVVGKDEVRRIVLGVSASLRLFQEAANAGADLALVHHGLFWERSPRVVDRVLRNRLKALFDHDIGLVAYHLPLDAHPEVGNNAELVRLLGIGPATFDFGRHESGFIGAIGRPDAPPRRDEFVARVRRLGAEPLVFPTGPERLERIAVLSGAGAGYLLEAAERGCDLLLTGEADEPTPALAAELGINVVAMGHYHSEKYGVMALGAHLADKFGCTAQFIDVPNPV